MNAPVPSDDDLAGERSRLLDIAFRMLGSSAEAENAVDATMTLWAAVSGGQRARIESRREWLTEILARTCFEHLRQARTEREHYVGEWLPEPIPHPHSEGELDGEPDAEGRLDRVSLDESLNMLLLVVLETLTPEQRVAFILHDVFGVPFDGIADVVGRTPDSTRQLAHAARHLIQQRKADRVPRNRHRAIVLELLAGCETGDEERIKAVLHPEITIVIDGGGKVDAAETPVQGIDQVARLLTQHFTGACETTASERSVNGHAGLVFRQAERVVAVLSANLKSGQIVDLWVVVNPDKLRHWNPA